MPIRPELRKYYGAEWRCYRETLLALAGHRCARCGTGQTHLNAADVYHDPRNSQLITIYALHATLGMTRSSGRRYPACSREAVRATVADAGDRVRSLCFLDGSAACA